LKDYWNVVDNLIMNKSNLTPSCTLRKLQELMFTKETQQSGPLSKLTDSHSKNKDKEVSSFKAHSEQSRYKKLKNPCNPGEHNPLAFHPAWQCVKLSKEKHNSLKPKEAECHHHAANAVSKTPVTSFEENNDLIKYAEVSAYVAGSSSVDLPPILDSGASHHMVNNISIFNKIRSVDIDIFTGGLEQGINATTVSKTFI
jgi:hypothetical protein